VAGIVELRQAVADLYNARYRKDKASKYTWKNVCITPGGRASLTRVAAAIGNVYVGFFLPEYTAYEEMLAIFKKFVAIPHALDAKTGYGISPEELRREIRSRGLGVVVTSNPSNPTGKLIEGEDLKQWVTIGAEMKCSMVFDEFYSAYIWSHGAENNGRTVSAAEYVEDVNKDPVIIVDGLTKSWRLPGWRISWVVAPEEVVKAISSSGSFLDGGANNPLQHSAVALLNPEFANNDVKALQAHFRNKRQYMIDTLLQMGFKLDGMPMGTFYVWADVSGLPSPLDNGISFFEAALKEKVICVPGIFFDINPGRRRELESSPYHNYIRFSYGPSIEELKRGLTAIEKLVAQARQANAQQGVQ
jgi:aspartate/methionine/tyrosine aminotransferase